ELGLGDFESITCSYLAQACAHLGQLDKAEKMVDEAVTLAAGAGQKSNEGLARMVWGEVRRRMAVEAEGAGRDKLLHVAGLELEKSLGIFQELGMEQEMGRSLLEISRLHREAGSGPQAREAAGKARDIFRKLEAQGDLRQAEEILDSLEGKT
ncbi:hypothetical protein KAX22_07285, partial [bacterium]|nr:hypothetical protein [bacterium]